MLLPRALRAPNRYHRPSATGARRRRAVRRANDLKGSTGCTAETLALIAALSRSCLRVAQRAWSSVAGGEREGGIAYAPVIAFICLMPSSSPDGVVRFSAPLLRARHSCHSSCHTAAVAVAGSPLPSRSPTAGRRGGGWVAAGGLQAVVRPVGSRVLPCAQLTETPINIPRRPLRRAGMQRERDAMHGKMCMPKWSKWPKWATVITPLPASRFACVRQVAPLWRRWRHCAATPSGHRARAALDSLPAPPRRLIHKPSAQAAGRASCSAAGRTAPSQP